MATDNEQTLCEIYKSWSEFQELLAQVPRERMEEGLSVGDWSVKDLLGHIATWEMVTINSVREFLDGPDQAMHMYTDAEVDDFNKETVEAKRETRLADILSDLEETHAKLISYLVGLPRAAFQDAAVEWRIRLDTYGHYSEHGIDLRRWLTSSGSGKIQ